MTKILIKNIKANLLQQAVVKDHGRILEVIGSVVKGFGNSSIGEICHISSQTKNIIAEVIGFEGDKLILAPFERLEGISNQSAIIPTNEFFSIAIGVQLLGRVLDGLGNPMDNKPLPPGLTRYNTKNYPPSPADRKIITEPIEVGVKSIDGMITCGIGQRIGIFAAAGGGKSTLMGMIVRNAKVDIVIIALIGERGREVNEFLEFSLGEEGLRKSIVVVATSDKPAIEQIQAAYTATAIAEYFRDLGYNVLLFMDSVTRFARAQRQIGLAAGEPPTRRGFPPSVFEKLPVLLERPGNLETGSITAFYTVLVEGDDMTEPVADETLSLLDGHIILSRKLAEKGHYPAVDVLASASRIIGQLKNYDEIDDINKVKSLMAKYNDIELLVNIGEYKKGSDALADESIAKKSMIDNFLQQKIDEVFSLSETNSILKSIT